MSEKQEKKKRHGGSSSSEGKSAKRRSSGDSKDGKRTKRKKSGGSGNARSQSGSDSGGGGGGGASSSARKRKLYPYSILRTANARSATRRKKKRVKWSAELPTWRAAEPGQGNPLFPKDAPTQDATADRDSVVKFAAASDSIVRVPSPVPTAGAGGSASATSAGGASPGAGAVGGPPSSQSLPAISRLDLDAVNHLAGIPISPRSENKGLTTPSRSMDSVVSPRGIHETYPHAERDSIKPALILSSRAHGATLAYRGPAQGSAHLQGRFSPRNRTGRFSLLHGKTQLAMTDKSAALSLAMPTPSGASSASSCTEDAMISRQDLIRRKVQQREQGMTDHELEDKDRYPDLIDREGERMLLDAIPLHQLEKKENQLLLATIGGPHFDENMRTYRSVLAARSTSTYPTIDGLGRAGDPICDFYYVRIFEESTVIALADGCNWGQAPKLAAQAAAQAFVRYLQDRLHVLADTNLASHYILRAIAAAHQSIVAPFQGRNAAPEDIWKAGTATLLGGVVIPLREKRQKRSGGASASAARPEMNGGGGADGAGDGDGEGDGDEDVADVAPDADQGAEANGEEAESERAVGRAEEKVKSARKSKSLGLLSSESESDDGDEPVIKRTSSDSAQEKVKRHKRKHGGKKHRKKRKRRWGFVFGSVGDCKAFLFRRAKGECIDLTESNRAGVANAKDCGGRLGPFLDGGFADLRNLALYYRRCDEGDVIILLSDGVHDNLDPELLGKVPRDLGVDVDRWGDLSYEEAERHKCMFREQFLLQLIVPEGKDAAAVTVDDINLRLIEHSVNLTQSSRDFMEAHPELELPDDYAVYPGKMDHTTCVCVAIEQHDASRSQCFVAPGITAR